MNREILYKMCLFPVLICVGCGESKFDSRQGNSQSGFAQQSVEEPSPIVPTEPEAPAPTPNLDPSERLTLAMNGMSSLEELQANKELFEEVKQLVATWEYKLIRIIEIPEDPSVSHFTKGRLAVFKRPLANKLLAAWEAEQLL